MAKKDKIEPYKKSDILSRREDEPLISQLKPGRMKKIDPKYLEYVKKGYKIIDI
jgi:hypothetical protein